MSHATKADKLLIKPAAGARPAPPHTRGQIIPKARTKRPVTRRVTHGTATTRLATNPDRTTRRVLPSPEPRGPTGHGNGAASLTCRCPTPAPATRARRPRIPQSIPANARWSRQLRDNRRSEWRGQHLQQRRIGTGGRTLLRVRYPRLG